MLNQKKPDEKIDEKLNEEKSVEDTPESETCVRIRPIEIDKIKTKRRGTKPDPPSLILKQAITAESVLTTPVKPHTKPTEPIAPPPKLAPFKKE